MTVAPMKEACTHRLPSIPDSLPFHDPLYPRSDPRSIVSLLSQGFAGKKITGKGFLGTSILRVVIPYTRSLGARCGSNTGLRGTKVNESIKRIYAQLFENK